MASTPRPRLVDGGLPLEVLDRILDYLCDDNKASLYLFATASKNAHSAALPFLFRNIEIRLKSCDETQAQVSDWLQILSSHRAEHSVRKITIQGRLQLPNSRSNQLIAEADRASYDDLWAFIAEQVRKLPRVTDLDYNCDDPFPPQLLDCLKTQSTTSCRIHLKSSLPSLLERFSERGKAQLLLSPPGLVPSETDCLHTINLTYPWAFVRSCEEDCAPDSVQKTIQRLVAVETPSVKRVFLHRTKGRLTRHELLRCQQRRAHTEASGTTTLTVLDELGEDVPKNRGRLNELGITGVGDSLKMLRDLKHWNRYIDFSYLCRLQLTGPIVNQQVLKWATGNLDLRGLKSLQIRIEYGHNGYEPGLSDAAVVFFDGLPPLRSLEVSGRVDSAIFNSICLSHGRSLRRLVVTTSESDSGRSIPKFAAKKAEILHMHMHCPGLEDLEIPICRSLSDKEETSIYLILGRMERLQRLTLGLDCSIIPLFEDTNEPDDPSFDEFGSQIFLASSRQVKNGHIRDIFVNAALDENLARSIWSTICGTKPGGKNGRRSLLQQLKVFTFRGADFERFPHKNQITDIVSNLSRRFSITKRLLADGGGIIVEEEGKSLREETQMYDRRREKKLQRCSGEIVSPEMKIFRSIWDEKKTSFDWRDDWESRPLDDAFLFENWDPLL